MTSSRVLTLEAWSTPALLSLVDTALKAAAETSALRAIGFASHVHTELIASARNAGADSCGLDPLLPMA